MRHARSGVEGAGLVEVVSGREEGDKETAESVGHDVLAAGPMDDLHVVRLQPRSPLSHLLIVELAVANK